MKKRIIPINLVNLVVILTVATIIALLTQNIIKELTIRDIQNVTRLTQANIYAEIRKEIVEPVNTSVIMAQNTLLFDFMNEDTKETEEKMAKYLSAIQKATGYESVFIIPHSTLNYYYPGGTEEKVNLNSDGSFWYKTRMNAKDAYSVVVNTEQLDYFALTLYVDANIVDKNGKFAGVAGVGKRVTHIQKILTSYLEKQGVEAYITDGDGLIQVYKDDALIKKASFYNLEKISADVVDIKQSREKPIEKLIGSRFYIIQYIPMLDWYLVVKKSSSGLSGALGQYGLNIMLALIFGTLIMSFITNYAISMYKKQIRNLYNVDHLTEIPNRTIFELALEDAVMSGERQNFCLALFDLDNLKLINDTHGHDKGDDILKEIAKIAKETFRKPDLVARVGGDEFAIIIYESIEGAKEKLEDFQSRIKNNINLQNVESTISIGVTKFEKSDTKTLVYKRADEALYKSKNTGKDKINEL